MRVYLDLCALKRPWDDQSQLRVARETDAMVHIIDLWRAGTIELVRSSAQDLENRYNTNLGRAHAIAETLDRIGTLALTPENVVARGEELAALGFRGMDALHLAWAEHLMADALVTTDDRFRRKANAARARSQVRTIGPIELVAELAS